jgi:cell division protein FtsI/penicillin-binding protein 2
MHSHEIPIKANRVLNFIILAFLLILIRVWYLGVLEHEMYLELSKKPQIKTVVEHPNRGTIRDRFNLPLAVNKIQYDIGICYDNIRQIPSFKKQKNEKGEFVKSYPRKEYIKKLSLKLSTLLNLDQLDIEDLIYGKASLFPATSFSLKEDVSEKLFYKIKGMERSYPGVFATRSCKRYYPKQKVGADLIGYTGSLNENEYHSIHQEIKELEHFISMQEKGEIVFLPKGYLSICDVKERLTFLKKKVFRVSEKSGKTGIEGKFDTSLRGVHGKKTFEVNTKGSIVRELPGSKHSQPGRRLLLNISSELQEFAESLLAENELIREKKFTQSGKNHDYITPPWIKGGAIVAMIPQTGEIVALASYPRIDSNDFCSNSSSRYTIHKWLENSTHLSHLWDGKVPLEREFFSTTNQAFYKEEKKLTYEAYLDKIFSQMGHGKKSIQKINSLNAAISFQKTIFQLLDLSEQPNLYALIDFLYPKDQKYHPSCFETSESELKLIDDSLSQHEPFTKELKAQIDKYFLDLPYNDDKLLIFDVISLVAPLANFTEELLEKVGSDSLSTYRKLSQAFASIQEETHKLSKEIFHLADFRTWREQNFKQYLSQKRQEEKEKKSYQKPYIDYLRQEEIAQFKEFYKNYKWDLTKLFIFSDSFEENKCCFEEEKYHKRFQEYKKELEASPLSNQHLLSSLDFLQSKLKSLDQAMAFKYLKTMRTYQDLSKKLYGYYPQIKKRKGKQREKDLAAAFYPSEGYGFGRSFAFRQSTSLGSIFKIITAYEAIKQNYERGFYDTQKDLNPLTIIDEIQPSGKADGGLVLGFHEDGRKIPRHYKGGTLPRSHSALGKIDYVKAFERSSNIYFSLLASDIISDPNDLCMASLKFGFGNKTGVDLPGEIPGTLPKDLTENRSGLYAFAIGQHSLIVTPLQTAVMLSSLVNDGQILKPQILQLSAGIKEKEKTPFTEEDYPYKDYLNRIGIFFPFFIDNKPQEKNSDIRLFEKTLYRKLFLPQTIKQYLLEGLHSVVSSPRGSARAELIRYLYGNTQAMRNYLKLKYQLAGKTSSAEIAYHPSLDRECPKILCKDIWFGGVSFKETQETNLITKKQEPEPEIVVVVYLKFGDFGKEAAPLAAEVVTKWREICKKEGKTSFITY